MTDWVRVVEKHLNDNTEPFDSSIWCACSALLSLAKTQQVRIVVLEAQVQRLLDAVPSAVQKENQC